MKYTSLAFAVLLAVATSAGAATLDLTTAGADGFLGGAYFEQIPEAPVGTGVFDPFVRIQGSPTEAGYNTDGTPEFDTKTGIWTHAIQVSDVGIVDLGGTLYREFVLDINEVNTATEKYLSLDTVKIFLADSGTLDNYNQALETGLGTKVFDLDAGANNWVKLNYDLNAGSGWGDMRMLVLNSLFTDPNKYLYLYSEFGLQTETGLGASDGFEEWAVRTGGDTNVVPEASTLLLAGLGVLPAIKMARFRRRD